MPETNAQALLDALLESWERSNAILTGLLRALPDGGLDARAAETSPSAAEQFSHLHHERLVSVSEEAPEFAMAVPEREWAAESDPERLAAMLADSARCVAAAVRGRTLAGRDLDRHFGHPVLLLQFLLWHEAYHHGQIKLALKLSGEPIPDEAAGPWTWDVWRRRQA